MIPKLSFLTLAILSFTLATAVFPQNTQAQENPEEAAKKYNISFPIQELGECQNFSSCRAYCDDPNHQDACISFAKKKGFYSEPAQSRDPGVINDAKSDLGCDSESSCRAVCEKEENIDKCSNFAQKHNLGGGRTRDTQNPQVLEKAKSILGCDSPDSCKVICEQEANRERCSRFANETGLRGGEHREGPGGCNSEQSCRTYCETHRAECENFGGGTGKDRGESGDHSGGRSGPGGCNSEESCMAYCQSHPEECGGSGQRPQDNDNSQGQRPEDTPGDRTQNPTEREDEQRQRPANTEQTRPQENSNRESGGDQKVSAQDESRNEEKSPEVRGVSTSPSFAERILSWLFR